MKDVDSLKIAVDHLTSTNIIRANLLLQFPVQNLSCLDVNIRKISILQALRLFEGIHFPNLDSFSTKTLPHEALCGFLHKHTSIANLTLGPCLEFPCRLASAASLPHLATVQGAAKCISSLVSYRTTRIVSECSTVQDRGYLQLFQDLLTTDAFVTYFSQEFHPQDKNFMPSLVSTMPRVSTLRLIEFHPNKKVRHEFCCLFYVFVANSNLF